MCSPVRKLAMVDSQLKSLLACILTNHLADYGTEDAMLYARYTSKLWRAFWYGRQKTVGRGPPT